MKVLIIEDDQLLRESTSMFLEVEGYETLTARNGLEGVKVAVDHKPNLILCDIAMPRVNGYEVFRLLNEHPEGRDIPFVFLTAKTEEADIEYGMSLGVKDYLTKPFLFDELLNVVKRLTNNT